MVSSPLLREWGLLTERIIPALLDGRPTRVWSVGHVADAVAVAAAYRYAPRRRPGVIRAFSGETAGELSEVTFAMADIRCLPVRTRQAAFRRAHHSWVPDVEIAETVVLANPREPVDLVTLRASDAGWPAVVDRAVDQLHRGGHLFLVDAGLPVDAAPRLERCRGLEPVDDGGRLYRKCSRSHEPLGRGPGDEEALTLAGHQVQSGLVASHAGLARSLARRFSHRGESKDDLEQVALLALVKAARRYDPSRDVSFSTYATASILGEIKRHFRDKTWMMRVPRSIQESYLALKEAREALTHELSCSPTIPQIAERVGISEEQVLEAMEAGENYWPESLDVGAFEGESGREVPVVDSSLELALERQELAAVLPRLTPRELLLLKRLYFDGWTQRQVADEVGVSQMQISRLSARTVEKLREWVGA